MKIHQNLIIDGVDVGDSKSRVGSKFCNEGKWDNFISPILPQGKVFVEYGSNGGLYLKLAKEFGYQKVMGVERNPTDIRVAREYRDSLGMDYGIIRASIKPDVDLGLPLADVTLLANFHYHQHINEFRQILNTLEGKTCYVLIVSANVRTIHWRAQPYAEDIKSYFRHWELVGEVPYISQEGDPHPREMFSFLFKSPKVERVSIDSIVQEHWSVGESFVNRILAGQDPRDNRYFRELVRRKQNKWMPEKIDKFVEQKKELILDVYKNGLKHPLVVDRNMKLVDGLHRYLVLKVMREDSAIVRVF